MVTITIGVPATSFAAVSVVPSSVADAPAFTHGLYSFPLARAQFHTGFTAVEMICAFVEVVAVTYYHMLTRLWCGSD